jgi:nucleoid DNA-binding protein
MPRKKKNAIVSETTPEISLTTAVLKEEGSSSKEEVQRVQQETTSPAFEGDNVQQNQAPKEANHNSDTKQRYTIPKDPAPEPITDKRLFDMLAEQMNVSQEVIQDIINNFFLLVQQELAQNKRIILTNFLSVHIQKIYKKPNPITHYRSKKVITYYAKGFRWSLKFKLASRFKEFLDQIYAAQKQSQNASENNSILCERTILPKITKPQDYLNQKLKQIQSIENQDFLDIEDPYYHGNKNNLKLAKNKDLESRLFQSQNLLDEIYYFNNQFEVEFLQNLNSTEKQKTRKNKNAASSENSFLSYSFSSLQEDEDETTLMSLSSNTKEQTFENILQHPKDQKAPSAPQSSQQQQQQEQKKQHHHQQQEQEQQQQQEQEQQQKKEQQQEQEQQQQQQPQQQFPFSIAYSSLDACDEQALEEFEIPIFLQEE